MQHDQIKGFTDQKQKNIELVNRNKEAEERILRICDELGALNYVEADMLNDGVKQIKDGFMWINRSIFQPQRIALPEDTEVEQVVRPTLPPVHIGEVFRYPVEPAEGGEDVVRDAQGNDLVALGPHWYRKAEMDEYEKNVAVFNAQATAQ